MIENQWVTNGFINDFKPFPEPLFHFIPKCVYDRF